MHFLGIFKTSREKTTEARWELGIGGAARWPRCILWLQEDEEETGMIRLMTMGRVRNDGFYYVAATLPAHRKLILPDYSLNQSLIFCWVTGYGNSEFHCYQTPQCLKIFWKYENLISPSNEYLYSFDEENLKWPLCTYENGLPLWLQYQKLGNLVVRW